MKKLIVAAIALSVGLVGPASAQKSNQRVNPRQVAAHGLSDYGFKLFQSLYDNRQSKDPVALSPMSIAEAVSMVTFGAEGDTRKELERLFVPNPINDPRLVLNFNTFAHGIFAIRSDLKNFSEKSNGVFNYKSANSLWGNSREDVQFKFTEDFKLIAQDPGKYGASLRELDFSATQVDEETQETYQVAVKEMNDWVAENTENKITKLIEKLRNDDVAVLMNAIYSKGKFRQVFGQLTEAKYTNAKGEESNVTMMKKRELMSYNGKDSDLELFSFKVEDPTTHDSSLLNQIAVDVFVPKKDGLAPVVSKLASGAYALLVSQLEEANVELTMPAGKVEQKEALKLKEPLKAEPFKITLPFNDSLAQFEPLGAVIDKKKISIGRILTKTFYEMTPIGFEAAAATAVVMQRESAVFEPEPIKEVKVTIDGPSLHVIRHIPSGAPLFIVEYDTPKLYSQEEIVEIVELAAKGDQRIVAKRPSGDTIELRSIRRTPEKWEEVVVLVGSDNKIKEELKVVEKDA